MIHHEVWFFSKTASPSREMQDLIEALRRNPEDEGIVQKFMALAERSGIASKGAVSLFHYLSDPEIRRILLSVGWNDHAAIPHPGDIANGLYDQVLKVANETADPDWVKLVWDCWAVLTIAPDEWPELSLEAASISQIPVKVREERDVFLDEMWLEDNPSPGVQEWTLAQLLSALREGWDVRQRGFILETPGSPSDVGSVDDWYPPSRSFITVEGADLERIKAWVEEAKKQ